MPMDTSSTKARRSAWIRVLAVALLVTAYCTVAAIPSGTDGRREEMDARMKGLITASLRPCLDTAASAVCGEVSISEVGFGRRPLSVYLVRQEDGAGWEDCWYYADRAPVVPGAIMQAATLAYYLDRGAVSLHKTLPTRRGILPELARGAEDQTPDSHIVDYERMTGKDSISVREGFLNSYRYVTDRYVLDDTDRGPWSEYRGFMDNLDRYFGTSDGYYVPPYYYREPIRGSIASICDGSGIILSQEQILRFYGSIANGGVRPPHRYLPKRRICSEEVANEIAALLRENVTEGTGRLLKDCPVPVSGKTGIGLLDKGSVPGYGSIDGNGEVRTCSFAGFFPSDNPRYAMCVTLYFKDSPRYALPTLAFGDIVRGIMDKGLL